MKRILIKSNTERLPTRMEKLDGKDYLVAPIVLMVEGVHHGQGGNGPSLYLEEELSKFPSAWNDSPVPVQHPYDVNGQPSACRDPAVLEAQTIGRIFNTWWDASQKKLRAEIWVDVNKAERVSPETLAMIRNGDPLEISTGLYSEDELRKGNWNGEEYVDIVRNIRPEHVAVLPNAKGACSWEDGCGVRANDKKGGGGMEKGGITVNAIDRRTTAPGKFKSLLAKMGLRVEEVSFEDVRGMLQVEVDKLDVQGQTIPAKLHFVREVYDDFLIYEARQEGEPPKLYKQSYSVDAETGQAKLEGIPEEVREESKYVALSAEEEQVREEEPGKDINTNEGPTIEKEGGTEMNKDEMIKALIEAEGTSYCQEDATWLGKLGDEEVGKLYTNAKLEKEEPTSEPPAKEEPVPEIPVEEVQANAQEKPKQMTTEEYLATLPPEVADVYKANIAATKAKKEDLVNRIMGFKSNTFAKEQLQAKDVGDLQAIVDLVQPVKGNRSLASPAAVTGELKPGEKGPDGMGVPSIPEMKWNADGTPDFSHLDDKAKAA